MERLTPEETADAATGSGPNEIATGEIKVSLPQIAYRYAYGYRVPADQIAPLQTAHADACTKQGPRLCRVINLEQNGLEGDYATGILEIDVAADKARSFANELAILAQGKGGEQVSTSVTGEDLSKNIVDTEARLRTRKLLAERLTEILRTRKGSVAELVEAERAVAAVNEEIDQAQSWLAEMRGRVAFSRVTINYQSGAPSAGGFFQPIRDGFNSFGAIIGGTIGAMITILAFALPWIVLIAVIIFIWRKFFRGRGLQRFSWPRGSKGATQENET